MIPADDRVERHYHTLEQKWPVVDASLELGRLVVPTGNAERPFHRWFHLKEAFSVELLEKVVKRLGLDALDHISVLDCFSGGGTTLVSALEMVNQNNVGVSAVGIERNPFLYLVSHAKVEAMLSGRGLARKLRQCFLEVSQAYRNHGAESTQIPALSTFNNPLYFPEENIVSLVRIRSSIEETCGVGLPRDILLTAAAAAVESSGRLRRDGRALRFNAQRAPRDPWEEFSSHVWRMIEDIEGRSQIPGRAKVMLGDGRKPYELGGVGQEYDLILFSPPYPNNIDYTEIYKMEGWYLGLYSDQLDFRSQRLRTVRSHPSVRFADEYDFESSLFSSAVDELISPLLDAIPKGRYYNGRVQLIKGYADDMFTLFQHCRRLVSSDGSLVFVVGNSAHGDDKSRFVIAADLVMAGLAELAGWTVKEIAVARTLGRRATASGYLRESVVTLGAS